MRFEKKHGVLKFGDLELYGGIAFQDVLSKAEYLGFDIMEKSENDNWSRFVLRCNEELFCVSLVFADLQLKIMIIYSKDGVRQETSPQDVFSLADSFGIQTGEYSWGLAAVGVDRKAGGYNIYLEYDS